MKKLIIVIIVLSLFGCSQKKDMDAGCDVSDPCKVADLSDYEGFMATDHVYKEATFSSILSKIDKKESFVVYFGFATCPWCVDILPILDEVAKTNKTDVYYVDVRPGKTNSTEEDIRKNDNADYMKFVSIVSSTLKNDDNGNKRLYVPHVFFFKNGELLVDHKGTLEGHNAKEVDLTDDQKEELTKELTRLFSEYMKK